MGAECLRSGEARALSVSIEQHELAILDMGGSSLEALERALGIEAVLEEGQAFRPKRRVGYVLRRDHADTGACMGAAGGDSGARGGDRHAEHAAARAKS